MGRITTGIGLISGINSASIIDQLMQLESQPKTTLQARMDSITQQRTALASLQTQFAGIKLNALSLQKPTTFNTAAATSSNENVLTATTSPGAAVGSYQFQVARLVSSQQLITRGFADTDTTPVGAGTMTIEMGGGELTSDVQLSQLNGGSGVRRGYFRVTDRSGRSSTIDISTAISLDDVVKKINTDLDISVKATIGQNGLVLTDLSGGPGTFSVQDLGDGHAAGDLGIVASVAGGTITGTTINELGRDTALSQLNDGRGVRAAVGGADFTITTADGNAYSITLGTARTLGAVLDAINAASPSTLRASINAGGNGIDLTDTSTGSGTLSVAALNSQAAADLGLSGAATGGVIHGGTLIAGLNTVLLASLRGGQGLSLGQISITNRQGRTGTVDLSAARSVQDVLDAISSATDGSGNALNIAATLNASQNGIKLVDNSGGSGDLTIGDVDASTAAQLGIAGTFDTSQAAVNGANLQRQWVSEGMPLSSYNGGKGITAGTFRITSAAGTTATIDLSDAANMTIGDVLRKINAQSSTTQVTASINANGDGILLTDASGGAGQMSVTDLDSSTAADLRLAGTATANQINGSFEQTITIASTDTLADVQQAIFQLGFGVSANIINDGSAAAPYRLSLTSLNPGRAGRVVFDAGTTGLDARTLVSAQDAAVFVGGSDAAEPLLVTASRNQIAGVVPGVTIDLHGTSAQPVSLSISRTADTAVTQIQGYVDGFNKIVDQITDLTKYDSDTNTAGLLLGDATIQQVQSAMYTGIVGTTTGGRYRTLADVGITLGDGGKLEFDEDKFRTAYGTDPESVKDLFAAANTGMGYVLGKQIDRIIDPVNGYIPVENQTLDNRNAQFQTRIDELDALLDSKRTRLEQQFANMESVLAGLQSQQSALSAITTPTYTTSTSKSA